MRWDTVVASIRLNQNVEEFRREMAFLRECGVFTCDSLLVVTDACNDVGSAGSALNALLITVEHMCAKNGYSVLQESLLESTKILILLIGSSSESFPLGAAFKPSLKILEKPWIVPDYPIVHAIRNVNKLATNTNRGVWICGTDALWELDELTNFSFNTTEIAAFYFRGDLQHIETHGVYNLDEPGRIKSINYCCSPYVADSPNIVLGLVYLPPALSTRFLSLHSIYPISRSTYYGIDSGALGLKLSLFFDVILATCLPEAEFVNNIVITEKSDSDRTLLEQSRREIWKRFHVVKCQAYCLPLIEYEYLGGTEQRIEISKQEIINSLHKNILHRISKMIQNHGGEHSTALLMTLMAINKFYDIKFDILNEIESLCLQNVSQCSHPLMLAAEYLALAAHGKGGLRSGPAANSAFTHIFDQIKTRTSSDQIHALFRIVRENWMHSETQMIRAARHLEAAAQLYTQMEVENICRKYIPSIWMKIDDVRPTSVTVEAAARIDLFGGWLDTPPITLHARPSAVVNMAILVDGKKPIACRISRCTTPGIFVKVEKTTVRFASSASIFYSHNKPDNPGALVCACLVCIGVPKHPDHNLAEALQECFATVGLEIECYSSLPHGSGLGTSSILAASIIRAFWLLAGIDHAEKNIIHAVLMVEQLLTTGGGWQDQVGCLYPGVKKGYAHEKDGSVNVEEIPISQEFESSINRRMVLIYTGKTRLARNLLQETCHGL